MKKHIVIEIDIPESDLCWISDNGSQVFHDIFVKRALHSLISLQSRADTDSMYDYVTTMITCLESAKVVDNPLLVEIDKMIAFYSGGEEMKSMRECFADEKLVEVLKEIRDKI